ncbi:MAG: hypothetical protein EBR81_17060 [Proteobacteria bacterium]|jgi:hypothetical protein|nr:hypothetical protein [Pseudomonadota bacterium]
MMLGFEGEVAALAMVHRTKERTGKMARFMGSNVEAKEGICRPAQKIYEKVSELEDCVYGSFRHNTGQ